MTFFKRKTIKILGFFSALVLFFGLIAGIILKENKNEFRADSKKLSDFDYQKEISGNAGGNKNENEKSQKICREYLEENENSLAFKELTQAKVVECMFVGCGALF